MILDATCGGRGMWFPDQDERPDVVLGDRRHEPAGTIPEQRYWSCEPTVQLDTRQLPFADETFDLIAYDPPHQITEDGMERLSGQVIVKYGALRAETWQSDLTESFKELWRVLKPQGTLTFKWADRKVSHDDVLAVLPQTPLFGTTTERRGQVGTRWWVFHKSEAARR